MLVNGRVVLDGVLFFLKRWELVGRGVEVNFGVVCGRGFGLCEVFVEVVRGVYRFFIDLLDF